MKSFVPRFLLGHPRIRRMLGVPRPPFRCPLQLSSRYRPHFLLTLYRRKDENEWNAVRSANRNWLSCWDATDPMNEPALTYQQWMDELDWEALRGESIVFALRDNGRIVGEISLGAMEYGAMRTAIAGYWVAQRAAGQGDAPLALALLADWAFFARNGPHLNRIEVDLLPSNIRSRRVVQKNGFAYQGIRPAWMHVAGRWEDHEVWDLLAADELGIPRASYRPDGPEAHKAASRHPCEQHLVNMLRAAEAFGNP